MGDLNRISEVIIGCAIEVHRKLGPGLLEGIYQKALYIELKLAGLNYENEKVIEKQPDYHLLSILLYKKKFALALPDNNHLFAGKINNSGGVRCLRTTIDHKIDLIPELPFNICRFNDIFAR